jgi:Flp pilus assembly protein CpaB
MKRRSWLWFVASIILAVLAGVLAIAFLNKINTSSGVPTPAPEQRVVVAAQALAAGTKLRADNVEVLPLPVDKIPSGAVTQVTDILGATTLRDFPKGDVIVMQDLSIPWREGITVTHNLEPLLGNDKIAVVLPADDILSQWGAVLPGDHVDVLFTIDAILETPMKPEEILTLEEGQVIQRLERDQSLDNISVLTVQNLEVLQVLEEPQVQVQEQSSQEQQQPSTPPRRALVLKIDPQDAVILKYLRDSVGKIDLALRSPTNGTLFDVEPVNINYLVLRYGIVLPQPLE